MEQNDNSREDSAQYCKNVGIWIRVSTEEAAKGDSPEIHEFRARDYARLKGWKVDSVYHLKGVSGQAVMAHPETQRMLDDVKQGRITGLLFSKLARLARNTKELLDFADLFDKWGADLISIEETIDTSTPGGRLFYSVLAALAQWEREEITERIKASVPIRAKLGKPINGKATLGYHWVDKKIMPDENKAPARELIYKLFAKHRRLQTVATILNSAGYRTNAGAFFNDRTIRRLIQDPTPNGCHRANYTTRSGSNSVSRKPSSEWVIKSLTPIVSRELWTFCNSLLSKRKYGCSPGRRPVQLFGGMVWCICGNKMYVPSNTPKYVCQRCRKKIGALDLEIMFTEAVYSVLQSNSPKSGHTTSMDGRENKSLATMVAQDLLKVDRDLVALVELREGGLVSVARYEERLELCGTRRLQLAGELARLQSASSAAGAMAEPDPGSFPCFDKTWDQMARADKENCVALAVNRILIGSAEIRFFLTEEASLVAGGRAEITAKVTPNKGQAEASLGQAQSETQPASAT